MPRIVERWLLFKIRRTGVDAALKATQDERATEKARLKYPERDRKTIGVGVIRPKA